MAINHLGTVRAHGPIADARPGHPPGLRPAPTNSASRRRRGDGGAEGRSGGSVDIAWLLADGASDRQISRELGISERTVSNEVREIGRRLGAANRAHTIARICGNPL